MVEKRTREISRANEELAQLVNDLENAKKAAEQGSKAKSEFLRITSYNVCYTKLLRAFGLNGAAW